MKLHAAANASVLALCVSNAFAQGYPSKPVRVMVGYAPGNAGGVAMEQMAKTAPDGYQLYCFDSGPLTVAPHLTKVGYSNFSSFTQLGHVCGSGSLLVVHPSTPFKSVAEVVAASKKEPSKWSYGTSGVGCPHHLSGEYFKSVTGANLLHVPYKGGGPAMTDLMGGQVPMLFSSLGGVPGGADHGRSRPEGLRLHRPVRAARARRVASRSGGSRNAGAGKGRRRQDCYQGRLRAATRPRAPCRNAGRRHRTRRA